MEKTTNYDLNKPEGTDNIDIGDLNDNSDIIDEKLYKLETAIGDLEFLETEEKADLVGAVNEVKDLIDSHKAESAKKHIHSSGGNASNGYWTRFDDGRQECSIFMSKVSVDVSQGTEQGLTIYRASLRWDFPKPFTEIPAVTAIGDTDSAGRFVSNRTYDLNNNSMGVQITSLISFSEMYRVSLTAKGPWK